VSLHAATHGACQAQPGETHAGRNSSDDSGGHGCPPINPAGCRLAGTDARGHLAWRASPRAWMPAVTWPGGPDI